VDNQGAPPVRRARHLMDPNHPVRPVNDRALSNVQRWVVSVLAVTTIGHLSVGLVVAAYFLADGNLGSQVGLCAIAGAFGVVAAVVGRVIHQKPILSPWLVLGLLPGVIGVVLILTL
jgi:hypothetical protein